MTVLVVLTVVAIGLLIAGLAFYLIWAGTLLNRVAANLEASSGLVGAITDNAKVIKPNLEHINETGRVVAGALPLLYGMGEQIVVGATWPAAAPDPQAPPEVARPASGQRRSRLGDAVGYRPGR
jgi:uncharacterized membrane protein